MRRSAGVLASFKRMVKELHRSGIAVILDVVFNHTGHCALQYLDKDAYFITYDGEHTNYSGCGNTLNCNDASTLDLVLDSLRFWVSEMHVDGFRFDEAPILGRGAAGEALHLAPLLVAIAHDSLLAKTIMIAEVWDAGGLMMDTAFSSNYFFAEWNGRFRDAVRGFLKGTDGLAGEFASRLSGSADMFSHDASNSVNFVTCHDGFTLYDVVAYNQKHNERNAEENRDGVDENVSWNCGAEGETNDQAINQLRLRQMKNFFVALIVGRGVPMIQMGDEYGHTRYGNNNTWCQDNELNHFQWDMLEKRRDLFDLVSALLAMRRSSRILHKPFVVSHRDVVWHGVRPDQPDWDATCRFVSYTLYDEREREAYYVAFNASFVDLDVELPNNYEYALVVNTAMPDDARINKHVTSLRMTSNSAIVLRAEW